jgi:hypothetical protein
VVSPNISARIEDWHDLTSFWIASFGTIATTFVAVSAGQCQVVWVIRTANRLWQHVVEGEANELPSFVSMAVLTAEICSLSNNTPR